jgi:hypothetical protein
MTNLGIFLALIRSGGLPESEERHLPRSGDDGSRGFLPEIIRLPLPLPRISAGVYSKSGKAFSIFWNFCISGRFRSWSDKAVRIFHSVGLVPAIFTKRSSQIVLTQIAEFVGGLLQGKDASAQQFLSSRYLGRAADFLFSRASASSASKLMVVP